MEEHKKKVLSTHQFNNSSLEMKPQSFSRFETFDSPSHKRIPSISGLPSTLTKPNQCLSLEKQVPRKFDFKKEFKLH